MRSLQQPRAITDILLEAVIEEEVCQRAFESIFDLYIYGQTPKSKRAIWTASAMAYELAEVWARDLDKVAVTSRWSLGPSHRLYDRYFSGRIYKHFVAKVLFATSPELVEQVTKYIQLKDLVYKIIKVPGLKHINDALARKYFAIEPEVCTDLLSAESLLSVCKGYILAGLYLSAVHYINFLCHPDRPSSEYRGAVGVILQREAHPLRLIEKARLALSATGFNLVEIDDDDNQELWLLGIQVNDVEFDGRKLIHKTSGFNCLINFPWKVVDETGSLQEACTAIAIASIDLSRRHSRIFERRGL